MDGYKPFEGLKPDAIRVIEGEAAATPSAFASTMTHCASERWAARWRTLNADVRVFAVVAPFDADRRAHTPEPSALGTPATAGYLSGSVCERPCSCSPTRDQGTVPILSMW
jgi:hypothetical protein